MKPGLVAFDLGNVLVTVDESRTIRELTALTGRRESEVFDAVFSRRVKASLETGRWTWGEFVESVRESLATRLEEHRFRDAFCRALAPNEPIFPIVTRVAKSLPVAVCSNTSSAHWEWARARLPFAGRLDPVIVSYEVGAMKPDRAIFDTLCSRSGVPRERILFIDDSEANVEGARAAGLQGLRFTGVDRLRSDLAALGVGVRYPGRGRDAQEDRHTSSGGEPDG